MFTLPLPWFLKRPFLRLALGYRLHRGARIGFSIVDAREVQMEEGARIGHLNAIRRLERLQMGPRARIGQLNWVSAFPKIPEMTTSDDASRHEGRRLELLLGEGSALMIRHTIDCSDAVHIGDFSWLGGQGTRIYTHEYSPSLGRMDWSPVTIGELTLVNGGCTLTAGTEIGSRCVLAGAAFASGNLGEELRLYGGMPARELKELDASGRWFDRNFRRGQQIPVND